MAVAGSNARRTTRRTTMPYYSGESSRNAMNAENSGSTAGDLRRNRPIVRRYARTSAEKRDWTIGDIHRRFVRAVDQLGGRDRATPKKILQLMEFKPESLTLGQLKSHLQMYRKAGKEPGGWNEEAIPGSDHRRPQAARRQPHYTPGISSGPAQPESRLEQMVENPPVEEAAALILLKEGPGRSSEFPRGSPDDQVFQQTEDMDRMQTQNRAESLEIVPVVELNDDWIQKRGKRHQQDPGPSSPYQPVPRARARPSPSFGTFLGETSTNNVVDSPTDKRKADGSGVELKLTMATRPRRFPSPSTQEEATLNLALS